MARDTDTPANGLSEAIAEIRANHRERRFAMKQQSRLDRALESLVRRSFTDWNPNASEEEREVENKLARKIIDLARNDPDHEAHELVVGTDNGRAHFDQMRKVREARMIKAAEALPGAKWVESVRGFGPLGFATIIGETGDLSNYPTHKHLWSRCGYAPYGNPERDDRALAGSTWFKSVKPPHTWAGRALSKEEWKAHPFNGQRYSFFQQIGVSMAKHQLIGKAKSKSGKTEAQGYYGEVYVARRAFTAQHRPDWSPMRCQRDAERIMMKALLHDLWSEWRGLDSTANRQNCRW